MKIPDKRCWAEVSPENLLHNYHVLRASLPAGCRFLGVVKADAYGHGALETARLLERRARRTSATRESSFGFSGR